jgi:signal transduction histidine kinase
MTTTFERIISYILGAIVGAGLGSLLVSLRMPILDEVQAEVIARIMPLIGLLVSMVIVEYQNERAVKRNNAIRDETVALITHEMRTSLTSTGWAIGLVLKKYETTIVPEDKKLLTGVLDSIHTTVMHSVNLLDVSLLDIGKLSISLEWTKLQKVQGMVDEMIEKYTLGAAGHGINLVHTCHLDPERMAEVDMLRLRIILENLLENAIQYTVEDKSSEKNTITMTMSNDEKSMRISIADTGIGIPESEKEKIFSEFYRASNARRKLSTGSGIGLYTCAKYVAAHRGEIRFESTENVGTTLYISIPLKTEADVQGFLQKI